MNNRKRRALLRESRKRRGRAQITIGVIALFLLLGIVLLATRNEPPEEPKPTIPTLRVFTPSPSGNTTPTVDTIPIPRAVPGPPELIETFQMSQTDVTGIHIASPFYPEMEAIHIIQIAGKVAVTSNTNSLVESGDVRINDYIYGFVESISEQNNGDMGGYITIRWINPPIYVGD